MLINTVSLLFLPKSVRFLFLFFFQRNFSLLRRDVLEEPIKVQLWIHIKANEKWMEMIGQLSLAIESTDTVSFTWESQISKINALNMATSKGSPCKGEHALAPYNYQWHVYSLWPKVLYVVNGTWKGTCTSNFTHLVIHLRFFVEK